MAALEASPESLLASLTNSLTSASSAFPSDEAAILPPADGISLLDVKNEILLSYLQNLVFLLLLRLRHASGRTDSRGLGSDVVKKLVELRVYLEKGVRPLEAKLKYQIDKVLRAAEDADRAAGQTGSSKLTKAANHTSHKRNSSGESNSDSEDSDASSEPAIDDLSYRPNPAALLRNSSKPNNTSTRPSATNPEAPYKPPRITPTSMPLPPSARETPRKRKSHLLDEYIDTELSSAPHAQPSIGSNSTILARGRGSLSARDRAKQKERTEYEERNFTRLPAESKAERRQARQTGGGRREMLGQEDFTGLGGLGDRVARSVGGGRDGRGVVDRREKRQRRETGDGQRGDGVGLQIGESFETRRRVLAGRAERRRKSGGRGK